MNHVDMFAQRLREKRAQDKLTQREVAERLSMSIRTIVDIETCKSSPRFEKEGR